MSREQVTNEAQFPIMMTANVYTAIIPIHSVNPPLTLQGGDRPVPFLFHGEKVTCEGSPRTSNLQAGIWANSIRLQSFCS